MHIEAGVNVQVFGHAVVNGETGGDSIRIVEPVDKKYFYIYFQPGMGAQRLTSNGNVGAGFTGVCYCFHDEEDGPWDLCEIFGTGKTCMWVTCPDCFYLGRYRAGMWRVFKYGGAVILEAESVNIVN